MEHFIIAFGNVEAVFLAASKTVLLVIGYGRSLTGKAGDVIFIKADKDRVMSEFSFIQLSVFDQFFDQIWINTSFVY